MGGLLRFNLGGENSMRALEMYQHFGKCHGYLLAARYGLPVSWEGFVLSAPSENLCEISADSGYRTVLCRPDAPMGKGNGLPRGRDLPLDAIPGFLDSVRTICDEAVILALKHPSVELVGHYVPRYRLSGGLMIAVLKYDSIVVEYVGSGFDVGDITRGRGVHWGVSIPWEYRHGDPADTLRYARLTKGIDMIDEELYLQCREERIAELIDELGEPHREDIACSIPLVPCPLAPGIFQRVCSTCLKPIIDMPIADLPQSSAVMVNLYHDIPYVFELFLPERCSLRGA
jgi:hypothetical protein